MMYQPATALCLAAVGPPASPSHDHRRPFSALSVVPFSRNVLGRCVPAGDDGSGEV